ncbi:hypothetical protein AABB24_025876, partial [Solanum stoloniferum]
MDKGSGSEKMFKAIGDQCGGWPETEDETSLKNHLKWARIKIKGDGGNIPKEVKIVDKGLTFFISIWSEAQMIVVVSEVEKMMGKDRWKKDGNRGRHNECITDK